MSDKNIKHGRVKNSHFQMRIASETKEEWGKAANEAGLPLAEFIYDAVEAAIKEQDRACPDLFVAQD